MQMPVPLTWQSKEPPYRELDPSLPRRRSTNARGQVRRDKWVRVNHLVILVVEVKSEKPSSIINRLVHAE
jgi:hypothetical protein